MVGVPREPRASVAGLDRYRKLLLRPAAVSPGGPTGAASMTDLTDPMLVRHVDVTLGPVELET